MASNQNKTPYGEEQAAWLRWLPYIALAALFLLGGYYIYLQVTGAHGSRVDAPPSVVAELLPPPPPLPPPPDTPPPEPQPQDPTDTPQDTPEQAAPDAPAPVTIAGPAQAGSDSYGLQSGSGTGSGAPSATGTCIGPRCGTTLAPRASTGGGVTEAFYRNYLTGELQRRVRNERDLRGQLFRATFAITIAGGRITEARVVNSSGNSERDEKLRNALLRVNNLNPPPSSVRFPANITVRGERTL